MICIQHNNIQQFAANYLTNKINYKITRATKLEYLFK